MGSRCSCGATTAATHAASCVWKPTDADDEKRVTWLRQRLANGADVIGGNDMRTILRALDRAEKRADEERKRGREEARVAVAGAMPAVLAMALVAGPTAAIVEMDRRLLALHTDDETGE